jgi:glycosyltransferase involved in cell wall biosynthesis
MFSQEEITKWLKPVNLDPLPDRPLVSVLTGNYNYAPFLDQTIESVLSQTYTNFEMIVCDDGSTDNSCNVVEHYADRDSRVRLIRQQNGGQASAWNTAYGGSKGEIVCFLDSDDRFLPEKLEVIVKAFRSYSDRGFLGHRVYRTSLAGRRDDIFPLMADPPSGWYGPFVVCGGTSPVGTAFGSALCLRREIGDLIFPLPEKFKMCADTVIIALGPLLTPLIGIPTPLSEYRYHGSNSWNSPHVSPDFMNRLRDVQWNVWEVSRDYLTKLNPRLAEVFPPFNECQGTLVTAYIQARQKWWGGAVLAYLDFVHAEAFLTIPRIWRWFWRASILLPGPVLFYAIGSNYPMQLLRKLLRVRRGLLASS